MESIRNFLKSRLGIILLVLCLSPLAILGLESYFRSGSNVNEVVQVGERSISRTEYQTAMTIQKSEIVNSGVEPSNINNDALGDQVLRNLINRELLRNQAQILGMHVSDSVINDLLLQDPRYADAQGQFSNDIFGMSLQQQGLTKSQVFNQYREQLNVVQLYNAIANTALYASDDINKLIALQQETRNAWLYRLDWESFISDVNVTEQEINEYYDTHEQELNSLAMVDLSYLVLDPKVLQIEPVTEEEIQAQYASFKTGFAGKSNPQVSQILVTGDNALDTMSEIQSRLNNGDSFEALAREFSEDPTSREKGGDIGAFNADVFGADAQTVEAALQSLKVGEVSEPVKTGFGYQIFKVTAIEGNAVPTLDSMREELKKATEQQKREILFSDKVTRVNEMAADGLSIEDIAQEESLTLKNIKDYTEVNNTTVLNQPAVIEAAFDDFNIQDEAVSTNIVVDDVTVWIQPTNYRPIQPLTREQAADVIKQTLIRDKAIAVATQSAENIADQVDQEGIDAVDIDFIALGEINRQHPILSPKEKSMAFGQEAQSNGLTAMAQQTDQGASVLVVDNIKDAVIKDIPESELVKASEMLRQSKGQEHLEDYLKYLEMVTEITKNQDIIDEITGL